MGPQRQGKGIGTTNDFKVGRKDVRLVCLRRVRCSMTCVLMCFGSVAFRQKNEDIAEWHWR